MCTSLAFRNFFDMLVQISIKQYWPPTFRSTFANFVSAGWLTPITYVRIVKRRTLNVKLKYLDLVHTFEATLLT